MESGVLFGLCIRIWGGWLSCFSDIWHICPNTLNITMKIDCVKTRKQHFNFNMPKLLQIYLVIVIYLYITHLMSVIFVVPIKSSKSTVCLKIMHRGNNRNYHYEIKFGNTYSNCAGCISASSKCLVKITQNQIKITTYVILVVLNLITRTKIIYMRNIYIVPLRSSSKFR